MLLYTIVPLEVVMAEDEAEKPPVEEEVVLPEGIRLVIRPDGMGGGIVTRLLSTDPRHFLDPRWSPGSKFWI
ncbi:MAG: YlzJ-like family protein [Firmicutes bacterium]|nr:YlzJ-like family protein [Bacillota bacterium]